MDVFDLVAKLTLDSSEYDSGLDESESKASSFGDKFKSALGTAGKVGATALGAAAAAGTAMAGALVSGTKNLAEYGDNIDKNSQKLGISREAYQEWDAILQHSGTSMDSMTGTFRTLQKNIESNSESFQQLGISEEQVATMSREDLFSAVITGLQGMEEGSERSALATELLGRGATELGALLNTSAEDTEAMRQRVHELGGVMSDEAVKSSAAFQDSLQDMQTSIQGLGRGMLSEFLPSVTKVMDGLSMIFSGDEGGAKIIADGVADMISRIRNAMPKMIATGEKLMESLLDVIIDNLPDLIEAGVEIIIKLAVGIVKALPKLLEKAPEIIKALLNALKENAPELLEAALEFIVVLGRGIVTTLPKLLEGAQKIITTLAEGLLKFIQILLQKAPEIIAKLTTSIIQNAPKLLQAATELISKLAVYIVQNLPKIVGVAAQVIVSFIGGLAKLYQQLNNAGRDIIVSVWNGLKALNPWQWGADLIGEFINGLASGIRRLVSTVSSVASTVWSYLHFSEPEVGPLADFHTYAPDMIDLFVEGLKKGSGRLQKQLADTFSFDAPTIASGASQSVYSAAPITVNVYGAQGQDEKALADAVIERLNFTYNRQQRAFA